MPSIYLLVIEKPQVSIATPQENAYLKLGKVSPQQARSTALCLVLLGDKGAVSRVPARDSAGSLALVGSSPKGGCFG